MSTLRTPSSVFMTLSWTQTELEVLGEGVRYDDALLREGDYVDTCCVH